MSSTMHRSETMESILSTISKASTGYESVGEETQHAILAGDIEAEGELERYGVRDTPIPQLGPILDDESPSKTTRRSSKLTTPLSSSTRPFQQSSVTPRASHATDIYDTPSKIGGASRSIKAKVPLPSSTLRRSHESFSLADAQWDQLESVQDMRPKKENKTVWSRSVGGPALTPELPKLETPLQKNSRFSLGSSKQAVTPSALEAENRSLKAELKQQRKQSKEEEARHQQTLAAQDKAISHLRLESEKRALMLRNQRENARRDVAVKAEVVERLENQVMTLQTASSQREADFSTRVSSLKTRSHEAQQEISRLQKLEQKQASLLAQAANGERKLEMALRAAEGRVLVLQPENSDVKGERDGARRSAEHQHEAANKKAHEQATLISNLEFRLTASNNKVDEFSNLVNNLKGEMDSERETALATQRRAEAECDTLKTDLQDSRSQTTALEAERDGYKNKIDELNKTNEIISVKAAEDAQAGRQKVEGLEEENASLRACLAELEERCLAIDRYDKALQAWSQICPKLTA